MKSRKAAELSSFQLCAAYYAQNEALFALNRCETNKNG